MGGPNTTHAIPDRATSFKAMDRSGTAATTHAQAGKRQSAARDDQAENRITEELNRQQVTQANGTVAPNPQTARNPADCSLGQAGCAAPAAGAPTAPAGPMP
jgi:hypothetical protein